MLVGWHGLVLRAGKARLNIKPKGNCHNALNSYFCVNGSGPLNTEVAMLSADCLTIRGCIRTLERALEATLTPYR